MMRAVRAWSAVSGRVAQAAARPAHTAVMRPLAAWQQPQQAARRSICNLRGFYNGLATATPQATFIKPKQRSARLLSTAASAPDVDAAAAPDVDAAAAPDVDAAAAPDVDAAAAPISDFPAGSGSGLFRTDYEREYHNFVAITGTLTNPIKSPSGDFSFVLKVQRSQQNKQPGQPDAYDSFVIEAPEYWWGDNELSEQLEQDMMVQVQGKLQTGRGATGAAIIKVLATDIGIVNSPYPEYLVAAGPDFIDLEDESQPSPPPPPPAPAAAAPSPPPRAASSQPTAAPSALPPGVPSQSSDAREALWIDLFKNPNSWWDNRARKQGRQPDFKQKAPGGEALWIEDRRTPLWVFDNVQRLPGNRPYSGDYRPYPAASGSQSFEGAKQLDFLPVEAGSEKEGLWMDVFKNYRNWWDNRVNKLNPKAPDFKHKNDGTALWLNSNDTPQWVMQNVEVGLPKAPPPRQTSY